MPHRPGKASALGHQHPSKRDELAFLGVTERRVQGLGRLDHLLEICCALRETIRRRVQAVHRRQGAVLLLLQREHARLGAVLDCGFKRGPKFLLVSGQPKTGLHALELGVESRLRPMLDEFGVRGLLIGLRGGGGDSETGSEKCGRSGRGGKRPKESKFHDDAWSRRKLDWSLLTCLRVTSAYPIMRRGQRSDWTAS